MSKKKLTDQQLQDYMKTFELEVMVSCFGEPQFRNEIMVSTKPSKLISTDFGKFVGAVFDYDGILVLNYYGLMKMSSGFVKRVEEIRESGVEVKSMLAPVVYFAGVKVRDITNHAPKLLGAFAEYKEFLVKLREFPARGQAQN